MLRRRIEDADKGIISWVIIVIQRAITGLILAVMTWVGVSINGNAEKITRLEVEVVNLNNNMSNLNALSMQFSQQLPIIMMMKDKVTALDAKADQNRILIGELENKARNDRFR